MKCVLYAVFLSIVNVCMCLIVISMCPPPYHDPFMRFFFCSRANMIVYTLLHWLSFFRC
jgi:hypothetical protein